MTQRRLLPVRASRYDPPLSPFPRAAVGMSSIERMNSAMARYSDVLLAVVVVLIISLMIIRIPAGMLDVLLAINIAASATILLVSLYIHDATRIAAFPTLLLLTTLFRLGLNVSSTRLILLDGYAGHVIQGFGDFVVGGNYVVGGVVFIIIVIIQFIVIAKGSERVSEVAARFTLDAVPGKQMAIDNDLRAGSISAEEAKTRRRGVEKESQLYGAMDGAMKFVKGDAIAGIIIALINIIGGLLIGVMQQGMPVGEAAQLYSLLTIGDGLVSQLPALLTCIAAGLVVTRVASSEDAGSHVAADIVEQILAQPKALGYVAVLMLGIGLLPGFPTAVFVTLAAILGVVAFPRIMAPPAPARGGVAPAAGAPGARAAEPAAAPVEMLPPYPTPIILALHRSITPLFGSPDSPADAERLSRELESLRKSLHEEMGLLYPPVQVYVNQPHLPENGYAIYVYGSPVERGSFSPDEALALCDESTAADLGIDASPAKLPWCSVRALSVSAASVEAIQRAGARAFSAREIVVQHLRVTLRRSSAQFLGIQEARAMLDNLRATFPALLDAVIPGLLTMQQVHAVLRRLLEEEVSIRDLRAVVESLARHAGGEKSTERLTELVRQDLAPALTTRYSDDGGFVFRYVEVAPDVQELLESHVIEQAGGVRFAGPLELLAALLDAVEQFLQSPRNRWQQPVILAPSSIRRALWEIVNRKFPEPVVMTYKELNPRVKTLPVHTLTLSRG